MNAPLQDPGSHQVSAWRFGGWRRVGLCIALASIAWGIGFYGLSVFIAAIHDARAWPLAPISLAVSFHFLFSAMLIVGLDTLYGRFGMSAVTTAALWASACGVLVWAWAPRPVWLIAAAALTAIGWAGSNSAAINAMLGTWFRQRRGSALALALNGASLGGIFVAPALVLIIDKWGLEYGMTGVALVIALVAPLIGAGLRDSPARRGQYVDNRPESVATASLEPIAAARSLAAADHARDDPNRYQGRETQDTPLPTRRALVVDRRFSVVVLGFSLALFAQVGLLTHMLARLLESMHEVQAAWWVGAVSVAALIGRNLTGAGLLVCTARQLAAVSLSIQVLGVCLIAASEQIEWIGLGCLLFGSGVGNLITLPAAVLQTHFSGRALNRAVALSVAVNQAAFSAAPLSFGIARDHASTYTPVFLLAAALMAAGAFVLIRSPTPAQAAA